MSQSGVRQSDPPGPLLFARALQIVLENADAAGMETPLVVVTGHRKRCWRARAAGQRLCMSRDGVRGICPPGRKRARCHRGRRAADRRLDGFTTVGTR